MKRLFSALILVALALGQTRENPSAGSPPSALKWTLSYLYDEDDSNLVITDLNFPTAERGIASGRIVGEKERNVVVVTSDGGKNWTVVTVKDTPLSLFFLNESVGWMATPKGIWKTVESGRSWTKLSSPKLVRRLYFLSEQHGFALCGQKSVFETTDGGAHWRVLLASQEPKANADYTSYETADFVGQRGMITGWSSPPREHSPIADWMDPEHAKSHREWPSLNIILQTLDGAKTWKAETAPIFGHIASLDLVEDGRGLAVLSFQNSFKVPSEVILINLKDGTNTSVFARSDRRVTEVMLEPRGVGYLAAIETPPQLPHSPVPGRLHVLRSDNNLSIWQEMAVDYRASGTRAFLSGAGSGQLWAATDAGAILKLATVSNK